MRLFKIIICICAVTLTALIYVHQQVELVKLSYAIGFKEKKLKEILDHKESLSYNIENLESPSRLERVLLAQKIDIAFPKRTQVVKTKKVAPTLRKEDVVRATAIERKVDLFGILEFFSPNREAQAEEK